MAHVEADRVKETTTSAGTGAITLAGAVAGFRSFASVLAANDQIYYAIVGGAEWEVGVGTFNGTLARTTVLASSNAGALVNFSAGTKDVFITLPAPMVVALNPNKAIEIPAIAAEPATPALGNLLIYAKSIAGRMMLKWKGPSGLDVVAQAALWGNNTIMWTPSTVTAGFWQGTVGAGLGTYTTQLGTFATTIYASIKRGRWANIVTTLNQILGQRSTELLFSRGAAAGVGGFFFFTRAGMDVWTNGGRFFAGLAATSTGAMIQADPSLSNNTAGFCVDAADNGAISFMTRNATAVTKVATGFTFATGKGYDLFIFAAPNGIDIDWRIKELNTDLEASGKATLTLPINTTPLAAQVLASNAALATVTAIQLGINRIYVETDY